MVQLCWEIPDLARSLAINNPNPPPINQMAAAPPVPPTQWQHNPSPIKQQQPRPAPC